MKNDKQTVNYELKDYVHKNIKKIIDKLVELNCIQEKVKIDYEINERTN
ncbi:MAG: hypothetical protein IJI98_03455 [Methanosphaera sp.]|nr:hypothetical protein [Bacilli bacterium]MBR0471739.1 hypothetical protein [Methanosphaera sp.]